MIDFKVHDRVRVRLDQPMGGCTGTVTSLDPSGSHGTFVMVLLDGFEGPGAMWSYLVESLEPLNAGEVRITSRSGGQKGQKLARFDLIPARPLWQLAEVYGKGSEKYDDRNWERGYAWSLSYAAAMRHMTQFWGGENVDPESGVPHPIAAAFHMMALTEFLDTHPEFDDRVTKSSD